MQWEEGEESVFVVTTGQNLSSIISHTVEIEPIIIKKSFCANNVKIKTLSSSIADHFSPIFQNK